MEKRKKRLVLIIGAACLSVALAFGILLGNLDLNIGAQSNAEIDYDASVLTVFQTNESGVELEVDESEGAESETTENEDTATAAKDAYIAAKKEIDERYNALYKELVQNANAQIEQVIADILGDDYAVLTAQYADLENQHSVLVSDFYASEEYVALKAEIDVKLSELAALTRNSAEYKAKIAEIVALYDQLRTLAADVNAQITALNTQARAVLAQIDAMITANYDAIFEQAQPIIDQFNLDAKALSDAKAAEIQLLQDTLGTEEAARPNGRFVCGKAKRKGRR